ncbi:MAG: DNA gyrase subunit A [Verrucomicrobia subdivision 3 bacterium]|nr:DNA gyrase subunit A [Limisphaerales bacterium]MCS1417803.1 DNA gyrase subunit A [Limisphaerales bacterium]
MADTEPPNKSPQGPADSPFASESIQKINVADEIKNSFLDYSMSVIVSRALPDARDGLKPSQRRILFAMNDLNVGPTKKHLKCAKIVGETMGNYHPHGDQAIYPTLVHMAQPWAMRDILVEGQGNFGSVEGDPPASMRYTEARMTHLGSILMEDMDKDTVDFVPNYDETREEPTVFPASFPNLLVNGGTGIAVGMATNIVPHNLGEVIDGVCAQIDNPSLEIEELMRHIKGPDLPTGCQVCGIEPIRQYFSTGRGSLKIRGKIDVEETKTGKEQLVITEIPYNVNRAVLERRIADLVNEKVITEIASMRNESDEHTRLVIELKRDAIPKVVINNLFKHTQLETTFSVNMLAIDHGRPKTLNLKEVINCYIEHRREVIIRRTRFDLRKAEARAEVLEGYLVALANLDDFIRIIRTSANRDEAKQRLLAYDFSREQVEQFGILIRSEGRLMEGRYRLSEAQVNAILELRLYQLTGLEIHKVKGEYNELLEKIKDLLDILAREERVLTIIKEELQLVKEKYATPRLTSLVADEGEMALEDLIANEEVIITLTHNGWIKRTNVSKYRAQRRGGKGVIGMSTQVRHEIAGEAHDFIEHLFSASTHDYLMFFTNTGRVYVERVHGVPDLPRTSKGRSIANVLELQADEKIAALTRIPAKTSEDNEDLTWQQPGYLLFATERGTVKKTALANYANRRKGGIRAIKIEESDRLIEVKWTSGEDEVVLISRQGKSIRFSEKNARPMGRVSAGVRGIKLDADDMVVGLVIVEADATLLVASEFGVGKRTDFADYRQQSRGGKGIITMKTTGKTGKVISALTVHDDDEIMLITVSGQMIRTRVKDVRETGRNTQGVCLMNLDEEDRLQAIAPVIGDETGPDDDDESADLSEAGAGSAAAESESAE